MTTSSNGRRFSYLDSLDELDDNSSDDEDKMDKAPEHQEEVPGWDLFRHFPPKTRTGSNADLSFYENALKALKVVTYFILFTLVLGGAVFAKATILLATAQVEKTTVRYCDYQKKQFAGSASENLVSTMSEEGRMQWYWIVVLAFGIPEVIALMGTLHHLLFKKKQPLPRTDLMFVCIVEGLHAIGMALLFLVVIPGMDSLLAIAVTSCVCFVPAVLGLLSRTRIEDTSGRTFVLMRIGDIIAVIAQASGIFLLPLAKSVESSARWMAPLVLILASCRWWPNYVSSTSKVGFVRFLSNMKDRLDLARGAVQGLTAICRLSAFFGTSTIIIYAKGLDVHRYFQTFPGTVKYQVNIAHNDDSMLTKDPSYSRAVGEDQPLLVSSLTPLIILLIHVTASCVTYFAGKVASRTLMQRWGLAFPISLIVPCTIVFVFVLSVVREADVCALHGFLPDYIFFSLPYEHIGPSSEMFVRWEQWLWIPWLLSQAWVTMHIWTPHCEKLATTGRLFAVSSYDSLMIDQSLMLSRRREDPEDFPDERDDRVAKIYVCATMWHELEDEMMKFLNSVIKLDKFRSSTRFTQHQLKFRMDDYYELETHVFFDDAFQCMHGCNPRKPCHHSENETEVNSYVKTFIKAVELSVTTLGYVANPPKKYPAPYGGRLEWRLPGKTSLTVHLKDKNKIRHRKRWSQVMYMYYLLGHRLMDRPYSIERKAAMAENTYLLTLDGDIDFDPSAMIVLLHLMKRDKELGAACGRIHPMGSGPMVWYQMFEYAIGHWLQKSTEHVIGSVLCSPGAFSLFRAKTLMEDNVMRKYATTSSEARHYVQYDQGEDRWLCTLILQAGGKVEYCAASDSYTHAPETFNEFFNQRRRWIPSTIANILDLLSSSRDTRQVNDHISWLYVVYEWILMGSTVLGPGTIFLMLVGAFVAAFRINNWTSFLYNLVPIGAFVVVCFFCKEKVQLLVAAIISAVYGLMMVVVLVGIMIQITEDGWVAPTTILFCVVALQLIIAGLLHPQEWLCLVCGLIYYITVPSMYMLLIIYSVFNLNNVTWGTRESKPLGKDGSQNSQTERLDENPSTKDRSKKESVDERGVIDFSFGGLFRCILCTNNEESPMEKKLEMLNESLNKIGKRLDGMEGQERAPGKDQDQEEENVKEVAKGRFEDKTSEDLLEVHSDPEDITRDKSGAFLVSPHWIRDEELNKGGVEFLTHEEEVFWKRLIEKYLHPIEEDPVQLAKTAEALKSLRDEHLFKFFMINGLFVLIVFLMQLNKNILHLEWPLGKTYNITFQQDSQIVNLEKKYLELEPIGCLFILGFVGILFIQFMAMLVHRFNTFCHVLANTEIEWKWSCGSKGQAEPSLESQANEIRKGLQRLAANNAQPISAGPNADIPRKRNTVHALIAKENQATLAPDFDTVFRQNLREPSANPRLTSMGISQGALKAFERRRTTVVQQRKSQLKRNNSRDIYQDAESARIGNHYNQIPGNHSHTYDNPAFLAEEELTPPNRENL